MTPDHVLRVAAEAAARALAKQPQVRYVPATIVTYDPGTAMATAILDGDDVAVPCAVILPGFRPEPGNRVMVSLHPPAQVLVIGTVGPGVSSGSTRVICTSSTRPSNPATGLEIYETDTEKALVWTGTAWKVTYHGGAWTAYTPTWTGAIGNGTITGHYTRVGNTVTFRFSITWGSTTTHPAGWWEVGLPVASNEPVGPNAVGPTGTGVAMDAGVANYPLQVARVSGTAVRLIRENNTFVTNVAPFAWAAGDVLLGKGLYEVT